MSSATESLSAIDHIIAGDWDRFLLDIYTAVRQRQSTSEYREFLNTL